MTWSDEDLRAYLNGDASPDTADQIEATLATDRLLEDRLMALDPLFAVRNVGASVAGPDKAQVARWLKPAETVDTARFDWRHLAAAVVFGVTVSSAGWLLDAQKTPSDWRMQVATYQALYSPETIAAIDFDDAALGAQLDSLGQQVGFPDLRDVAEDLDDFELLRGQILAHQKQPLAQIVFASMDGQPMALCLIERATDNAQEGLVLGNMAGLRSASFDTKNHSWLLIGAQNDALIERTAQQVLNRLTALESI